MSVVQLMHLICNTILVIIIYLYQIAILNHGMQSFHIIVYSTPVYCMLVYCTIADRSDRFATLISLREMFRNELVLKLGDQIPTKEIRFIQ